MKPLSTLSFALLLCASVAQAGTPVGTFPENPALTTGVLDQFYSVLVDGPSLVKTLKPVATLGEAAPSGDLVLKNERSGIARLTVNDVVVGEIPPLGTATIHGVTAGQYDVTFEYLNQFKLTARLATTPTPAR